MRNMKKMIATLGLAVALMMTVSTAKAGIIMHDLKGETTNQPCTEKNDKTDWGIFMNDLTGVVVVAFTGIIIIAAVDTPVECGVVVQG